MKTSPQFRSELNLESEKFIYDCGWNDSKDHIIELLENLAYIDDGGQEMITESKRELIELIKGETK